VLFALAPVLGLCFFVSVNESHAGASVQSLDRVCGPQVWFPYVVCVSLCKIFVYFEAVMFESTILACIPHAHLHCPPWCNTIARFLDSMRDSPSPTSRLCVCYTPYNTYNNTGNDNLVLRLTCVRCGALGGSRPGHYYYY